MRVAAVQHDIVWEDAAATTRRVTPLVNRAVDDGAQLVVLTEMFATGFSMDPEKVAEKINGPASTFLRERAAACGVWMAGSIALRPGPEALPVNRLLLAGADGTTVHYDKRHPFTYAGEHERYAAGRDAVVVNLDGVRLGLSVCYDLRFADGYWAQAPEVDGYVVVANWPEARRHHWLSLLGARAIENQAYVIGVNRVGKGGGLDYCGDSRIIGPSGEVLAAADNAETVLTADVDPDVVAGVRRRFPFLADR